MIWHKKYGNFLNPPAEQIMQTVFIAFKSDRIGPFYISKHFVPTHLFQMFGIFTTTYSINVFMNSVFLFGNSPKISNIILQIFEILRYSLRWRLPFINLCRYTIYFLAINPKVSITFFSVFLNIHKKDLL